MNSQIKIASDLIKHKNSLNKLIGISELVCWRLDDVLSEHSSFDFEKALLPEAFFPLSNFGFLSEQSKKRFNHILSHSYLNIFELSEEFIIGMTVQLSNQHVQKDRIALRALSKFTEEEVKHQQMFERARSFIQDSFAFKLNVLDDYKEISDYVLSHSHLSVLLLVIHLELITQAHYIDGVKERKDLDPLFCSILRNHWVEECQHVKIDIIEFNRLAREKSAQDLDDVYQEYQEMIMALVSMLHQQAQMNVSDLNQMDTQTLSAQQTQSLIDFTHESYCIGLLKYGFANQNFKDVLNDVYGDSEVRINRLSREIDQQILALSKKSEVSYA